MLKIALYSSAACMKFAAALLSQILSESLMHGMNDSSEQESTLRRHIACTHVANACACAHCAHTWQAAAAAAAAATWKCAVASNLEARLKPPSAEEHLLYSIGS